MRYNSRVFITGLGTVSSAGSCASEVLETMEKGVSSPKPAENIETELEKPVFEVRHSINHASGIQASRTAALACLAVEEALKDAKEPHLTDGMSIGVCLGTTVACQLNDLDFYRSYRQSNDPDPEPVRNFLNANLARTIADTFACTGPHSTVVNACSSGTDAIGTALSWLKAGLCNAMIAGGADELNLIPLCGFNSLGVISEKACRPFDLERDGLNLGEGAGVLFLETESSAKRRGAPMDIELKSYGSASDAYHMTAPHPEGRGLKLAIRQALSRAGLKQDDCCFVNAHGTATADNDLIEGAALCDIFGPEVLYYSTKGLTGHTLGAAGGLEAVFTVLNLRHGWIPCSAGFSRPDPDIPVPPVTRKTAVGGPAALSTSLAFGGSNSALIVARTEYAG